MFDVGGTDMSGKLLEKLAQEERCFISDLTRASDYMETIHYLKSLDLSQFSLEECSYAFSYIFREPIMFSSHKEVYDYLNSK